MPAPGRLEVEIVLRKDDQPTIREILEHLAAELRAKLKVVENEIAKSERT